jgi:hypothetical protein
MLKRKMNHDDDGYSRRAVLVLCNDVFFVAEWCGTYFRNQ